MNKKEEKMNKKEESENFESIPCIFENRTHCKYKTKHSQFLSLTEDEIIESMKIMNEIECEYDGIIKKILVKNSDPVEFNQPLFIID